MNESRIKSTGDADTYTPHKQLHARYKFLSKHDFNLINSKMILITVS